MLMGEYNHSLDAKGRVILPADFRVELGESFIITKGLDNCLFIYPQSEWEQLSVKLRQLPLAKTEARAFVRFFFAGARQVELDKQGRFLIPIGVSNRIEVWSKDEWLKYNEEITPSVSAIAETLAELGI